MKKTIAILALTALALAAHGQTQTFYSIAKFQTNVFLNDAPTVPLHTRVPTGNVLRATASYIRPEQDLILQGNLTLDTNKSLTLVNDSGVGIVSNGVVLGYNGEIILRRFVSGEGWYSATINPTSPLPEAMRLTGDYVTTNDTRRLVFGGMLVATNKTIFGSTTNAAPGTFASVVCGNGSTATGDYAIAGGVQASASGYGSICFGHDDNDALGESSVAIGGNANKAVGYNSVALGGYQNYAGIYAFAAGVSAKATNTGAFVWGDAITGSKGQGGGSNSATFHASGGFYIIDGTNIYSFNDGVFSVNGAAVTVP